MHIYIYIHAPGDVAPHLGEDRERQQPIIMIIIIIISMVVIIINIITITILIVIIIISISSRIIIISMSIISPRPALVRVHAVLREVAAPPQARAAETLERVLQI